MTLPDAHTAGTGTEPDHDVVVVGAGPAGSTAAISVLQHRPDLRVAIVDKAVFPRDKSCGDGIGPGVVRVVRQLGLEHLLAAESSPTAVRVVGPDGLVTLARGPRIGGHDLRGYVVPRRRFDTVLLDTALDLGAEKITGSFVDTSTTAGGRAVQLRMPDRTTRTLTTRLLVGADGAYSRVRRALGLSAPADRHRHIAMRAYCELTSPEQPPALQLEFTRDLLPAYGWVFPLTDGGANIGVGVPLDTFKRRGMDLHDMLDGFAQSLRARGYHVGDLEERRAHHLPHSGGLVRMQHRSAILIGDAAGTINALSGEGIYYGMRAGLGIGRALRPVALDDGDAVDRALRRMEGSFRRILRRHLQSSLAAHHMLQFEPWARLVVGAAAADERVTEGIALMLFDDGAIRPGTTARILRHGMSRRHRAGAARPITSPRG